MNQEKEQHLSVLNQVIAWRGIRKEATEVVIHFSPMKAKVFIWTFRDRETPEHVVIHQENRTYLKFEVVGGELGSVVDRVDALYRTNGQAQQPLSLSYAS